MAALYDPLSGLPPSWEVVVSEYGSEHVYYWNRLTNETTWQKPVAAAPASRKRTRSGGTMALAPSGCFLWPAQQQPARRATMKQHKDVFAALLKRGMPAWALPPAPEPEPEPTGKGGKTPAKGKGKGKSAGKSAGKESPAKAIDAAASSTAPEEWWRGSQSSHAYLPLQTLVMCFRVSKAWRAALLERGFNYGVATLGLSLARWRADTGAGAPRDDVDALAELSKRLSIYLQSQTLASGRRLSEVRQFLFRHAELSQKNATCREDPSAKPFLPALLQGSSWNVIFDAGFWLSMMAREPSPSYLSDGVKGMMWAFASPSKLPADLDIVRDASEEVHVAEDDEAQRFKGKAARWNPRGFGFIKPIDGGDDLFCHASVITDGNVLREGDIVEYAQEYDDRTGKCRAIDVTGGQREEGQVAKQKKQKADTPALKKGKEEIQLKRGVNIVAMPGGGDVGGSSSYKISNREATRDMDWLCAISSMEGTQHKTMRKTNPKPKAD